LPPFDKRKRGVGSLPLKTIEWRDDESEGFAAQTVHCLSLIRGKQLPSAIVSSNGQ
jgi:hypothetical protein